MKLKLVTLLIIGSSFVWGDSIVQTKAVDIFYLNGDWSSTGPWTDYSFYEVLPSLIAEEGLHEIKSYDYRSCSLGLDCNFGYHYASVNVSSPSPSSASPEGNTWSLLLLGSFLIMLGMRWRMKGE